MSFDNDVNATLTPAGAAHGEFVELGAGGEWAAIAISVIFRGPVDDELRDHLFVFGYIAADPIFPGPHKGGEVLEFAASDFGTGDGLLSGFASTKLTVTVGPTRETHSKRRWCYPNQFPASLTSSSPQRNAL